VPVVCFHLLQHWTSNVLLAQLAISTVPFRKWLRRARQHQHIAVVAGLQVCYWSDIEQHSFCHHATGIASSSKQARLVPPTRALLAGGLSTSYLVNMNCQTNKCAVYHSSIHAWANCVSMPGQQLSTGANLTCRQSMGAVRTSSVWQCKWMPPPPSPPPAGRFARAMHFSDLKSSSIKKQSA
jgi:hypothetical protein